MKTLREKRNSLPFLALPSAGGPYTLNIDACDVYVGCVLLQVQPDKTKKLVGYLFRSLTREGNACSTTQPHCSAIARSVLLQRS